MYIASVKVTTLNHKVLDNTVESRAFEAKALLTCKTMNRSE